MNRHGLFGAVLALVACAAFVLVPGSARAAGAAAPAAKTAKKAPAKKAKKAKKPMKKMAKKGAKKAMKKHAAKAHAYKYTGEVLDLDCYLEKGAHGAKHASCAVSCLQDGAPAGLLDHHRAYLLIGEKPHMDAYKAVRGMAAKTVTITGHKVWRHGIPAIIVEAVKAKG